jgi:hypothetical protein
MLTSAYDAYTKMRAIFDDNVEEEEDYAEVTGERQPLGIDMSILSGAHSKCIILFLLYDKKAKLM